jgi:hypothetical protein
MQFAKPMPFQEAIDKLGDQSPVAGFFYWIFYDDTAADTVRSVAKDTPGMNVPK